MGQGASTISIDFQNRISDQFASMKVDEGFIFLSDLSSYLTKILKELIGKSYVEIAKHLIDDELRIDEVHKYVAKIIQVLQIDNRAPNDLKKATQDLFELIDGLEKARIAEEGRSPDKIEKLVLDYLDNLNEYVDV